MGPITFDKFQEANKQRQRIRQSRDAQKGVSAFDIQEWALAICGEAGELANLLKKIRRGDFLLETKREDVIKELADIITYCDLAMTFMGGNTGEECVKKFDEVSDRFQDPHFSDLV